MVLKAHALPLAVLVDVAAQSVVVTPACPVVVLAAAEKNAGKKEKNAGKIYTSYIVKNVKRKTYRASVAPETNG